MPILEVASFKASKAFAPDNASAAFDKALNGLKATDGCLSVYHGSQLDDKMQKYVIVVRGADNPNAGKTKLANASTLEVEFNKLGISQADDLSVHLFAFDADPTNLLDAPLPQLWYTRLRDGYTQADGLAVIKLFYAKLEDREYGGTLLDEFPPWLVGLNADLEVHGPNVYLVGWESDEKRQSFLTSGACQEHLKRVEEVEQYEAKALSIVKV